MRVVLALSTAIAFLSYVARCQFSCTDYDAETPCNFDSGGTCSWIGGTGGSCRCKSEVKLDILFAVDTSGSIGLKGFQVQKEFLGRLVTQGINNGSKIGFVMFSTNVNFSVGIQPWETDKLERYVSGLYWKGGYTNTPNVIEQSLSEFEGGYSSDHHVSTYAPDRDRQKILMMITDGNPCLPESLGGCPQSVCQFATQLKLRGIRVIIIGVGDGLNTVYVECLTQNADDFIPVVSFSTEDFNSIMQSLSGVLCPVAIDFKVTEVKAMKKPPSWIAAGDGRYTRFIEFYNNGIEFNLQDIKSTGFITMGAGPDVTVPSNTYVVFYDAADALQPSVPSCHLCGSDCDLGSCTVPPPALGTEYCWCGNSVYVGCKNTADSSCAAGLPNDAGVAPSDACDLCTFNDGMSKSNWNIRFTSQTDTLIDEVIYTGAPAWFESTDKFSYELRSKGLNNDFGDNWAESCSPLGTPGADPAASCELVCQSTGCNGGTCQASGNCDCSALTGYYPSCTSPTSCTRCVQIPPSGDCDVYWTKNGTERIATFNWTLAERDAETRYVLHTYSASGGNGEIKVIGEKGSEPIGTAGNINYQNCKSCLTTPIYATTDYWAFNKSYGGYVQVAIDECLEDDSVNPSVTSCQVYYSEKTICNVITAPPTRSPTRAPSKPPTRPPTNPPTFPPTHACPEYFWTGGTQQKICKKNDRCNCYVGGKDCCLLEPVFEDGVYDANRQHHEKFDCKMDVQKLKWQESSESEAGSSPGYLLTTTKHYFEIDITPEDYECPMEIFWRFEWDRTDCNYDPSDDRRRRRLCDSGSRSLEQAGLTIDTTSGWLKPQTATDENALVVSFTVKRIECESGGDDDDDDDDTRRRLAQDESCYENVALYGRMVIVNATSTCRADCYDGRIFPMEIPVWFNYADAFYIPPGQEKELPPWLWWLVAALVIFLCCLALLLYKYWWKAQATGAALDGVQKDLDQAVYESEVGFGNGLQGNQVGFNPLATGFNPNAPAGNGPPNRPPNQQGGAGDFIRPNVERPVFKQQYGQQTGAMR